MTRIYDDPTSFADDALAGFADAFSRHVARVPGGVVRATVTRPGKVALVVGGGSGHYPAFCGLVGPGIADGAVVGNVFASPSSAQVCSVARSAEVGAGVLLAAGNYTGDVMNFTMAQGQLRSEGIDVRTVFVTDDVASAPAIEIGLRRGIAGNFVVFKIAGAAAEAGYGLDEVERVARLANDRTRTLGVAFAGCTLPGQDHPMFVVPDHKMGVGLGIHGEPGVSEDDMARASELAALLVHGVLGELAEEGDRVAAVLNGLGATKSEELFVLWHTISSLLAEAGLTVVEPEIGELVTSLDMSGCSLSVIALDEELEQLWRAPAETPAYHKAGIVANEHREELRRKTQRSEVTTSSRAPTGSPASQVAARTVLAGLSAMSAGIARAEEELGRLDAIAGDGDHGRGMARGVGAALTAARRVVDQGGGARSLLEAAGDAWSLEAGGTSGILWGAALRAAGDHLQDDATQLGAHDVVDAVRAGLSMLRQLGKADVGDKTMLDALVPFSDALGSQVDAGSSLARAWRTATAVAEEAAEATAAMRPRVGRARPLAERSVGSPDPGAVSLALCLRAVSDALGDKE